jgi:dihydrofolate reductase
VIVLTAAMSKVIFDISMSLDGFVTGPDPRPEAPNGDGGERLVEWAFGGDDRDRGILEDGVAGLGAVIAGRRTYELSLPFWGPGGPSGDARAPVFVLSHGTPDAVPDGGVYTFVNGVESALDQARAAAGDRYVVVMGGAETGRQYLEAGLVDELSIHLVPIELGSGTRLFDAAVHTDAATHLRLRLR